MSTALTVKFLGSLLSSTNGLSLAQMKMVTTCTRPSSAVSTAASGDWEISYTILSTMKRIAHCMARTKIGDSQGKMIFGGHLGEYKHYNMDPIIAAALVCVERVLN